MRGFSFFLAGASLFVAHAALAQSSPQSSVLVPSPDHNVLRVGTPVPLKLMETLTTKHKQARVGQRFHLEVAEDVSLNGRVVIPAGTPAMGEITDVRNKGMWGKSGHISARVLYLQINGRQIRLSGTFDEKGSTGTGGVVASAVLVPIAGFFVTGTSAHIPLGAPVAAFIDEDVPIAFAEAAPAPLTVQVPVEPPIPSAPVPAPPAPPEPAKPGR